MAIAARADGAAEQTLLAWLDARGARFPALEIRPSRRAGRAVFARRRVERGEVVLWVPRACLMTPETIEASRLGRALGSAARELQSRHSLLAAWLLSERLRPRSPWRPYVDALPGSCAASPLVFGRAALAALEGSFLLDRIRASRRAIALDWTVLRRAVKALGALPLRDFVWARTMVESRAFSLAIRGQETTTLAPLADMLNHERPCRTRWGYRDEGDAFVVTASASIDAGEEVHSSYGSKRADAFFLSYGFTIEDGAADHASISLGAPVPAAERCHLVPATYEAPEVRRLFSALRRAFAAGTGLLARPVPGSREVPPISASNELLVLQHLLRACEEALARFPTSIEDDDALLRDGALPEQTRACVVMRRKEKRVLGLYRDLAQGGVAWLEARGGLIWPPFRALDVHRLFKDYVAGVLRPLVRT